MESKNAKAKDEGGGGEGRKLTCGGVEAVLMVEAALLSQWRDSSVNDIPSNFNFYIFEHPQSIFEQF